MSLNNIVVVGGGPVGLFTAVQTAIQANNSNKNLNIVVIDKRNQYQRNQILRINRSSFFFIPQNDDLKALTSKYVSMGFVPIQMIENDLKELATKLGVQFQRFHLQDGNYGDFLEKFSDAGCVIGADGARSYIRQRVFGNELNTQQTLQYLAQVKFTLKEPAQKLGFFQQLAKGRLLEAGVQEFIKKDGREISIRFFIDQATYRQIEEAKERNPWSFNDDSRIPLALKKRVEAWMKARKEETGEEIEIPPVLTAIQLQVYSSKKLVKDSDGKIYALVGDAAGGVPFFRSINKGFLESSALSRLLAQGKVKGESREETLRRFNAYQTGARVLATKENAEANLKAFAANLFAPRAATGGPRSRL